MDRPDLDAIEGRLKAATPGPWHYDDGITDEQTDPPEQGKPAALCDAAGRWLADFDCGMVGGAERDANGRLCASARADVPTLLTYARALEAERGRLALTLRCERGERAPEGRRYDFAHLLDDARATLGEHAGDCEQHPAHLARPGRVGARLFCALLGRIGGAP